MRLKNFFYQRSHKRFALLAFSLLLIAGVLSWFLWARTQQNHYALNRQLIEALKRDDTRLAIALVEAGADPNTRQEPPPNPSLPELIEQFLHSSPPPENSSPTAFMMACGDIWTVNDSILEDAPVKAADPQLPLLMQAMCIHGANLNLKENSGITGLEWAVMKCVAMKGNKATIQKLLNLKNTRPISVDTISMDTLKKAAALAERLHRPDIAALLTDHLRNHNK